MANAIHNAYPNITLTLDYDEFDLVKELVTKYQAEHLDNHTAADILDAMRGI